MARHVKLFLLSLTLLCILSEKAFANAGTPLMWAGLIHLTIGNLLIGIGEGLVLGFLFRISKLKSIGIMIVANYFSAWWGYLFLKILNPFINHSITINEIHIFMWIAYGIAFLFTLFAEMPFVLLAMRKKKNVIRSTLIASLVIQSISYSGIFYWYWGSSYDSVFRNAQITHSYQTQHPKSIVFFIGEDQDVYEMCLDGSGLKKVFTPLKKQDLMKLYLHKTKEGANLCLSSLDNFYTEREENCIVIKKNILPTDQINALDIEEQFMVETEAIDYRKQHERKWTIYTGFWAAQGLRFWNNETEKSYYISLETLFAQWYVRSATVLPKDEVIFQFGNQICIYSRPTKQLHLLERGKSPVVIFNEINPVFKTKSKSDIKQ